MHQAPPTTIHCPDFSNDPYDWAARLPGASIRIMNTKIGDEDQEWPMLFIKGLIKRPIQKPVGTSNNSVFILSRPGITNTFTHPFFTKLSEELRLMMLQYLDLTSRLALKLTCVQLWNFVDDHFNRPWVARGGDYFPRSALLDVTQAEHWDIFATQNLLGCSKCHLLRHSSKFDDQQAAAGVANRLCMRERGHGSWAETNRITIKGQHFGDPRCSPLLLEAYDPKYHN